MEPSNEVKVIRAPSLKRGKNDERLSERIKLKKVIGLTVCSNAGLDVSLTNGILAYPAGCTVVLFNPRKVSQSYLQNSARKAITAVAYSHCGRYLATGECGINPTIKVWELETSNGNCDNYTGGSIVAEFSGHKYAVSCVAFSPTGKYLVSVGSQHDNIVNVFDWKANTKIASNKVSAKVVAVSFSIDGNYFVTVGNRHVKFWYLEGGRRIKEPVPLMGRSAILGELRNNDFTAVACGKGDMADSTYAITRQGHLVEFNARRLLDKWVMCRTASANCIVTSAKYIFVGCGDAIIRCFNAETLEYITTLPRTHFLGVDVAQGIHINHMMAAPPNAKYPDCIAIVYDETRSKVSCIYNDHSLYIWDLRDVRRVGKSHSFLYHSACIWGVETVPFNYTKNNIPINLPSDCFLTCSSDDTIRVWGLDDCETNEFYRKNIYSKDLLKVFYIDDELNFIKDMDNPLLSTEKNLSYDGRNGVRCIKVNSTNGHLATGDRSGNIRIYNFNTLKLLSTIEAHDSEVLCLEYTNEKIKRKLLASASRDRLIHIFDVEQDYKILQTLDDHSSSITSVRFVGVGNEFSMISCGADKSIIFRSFQQNFFARGNNSAGKATLYDMEVDSNSKHILTACQDRNIRVYSTQTAKQTKTFKGSHSEEGSLIKLCLDLSGIYIATSCTDKTLSVYDYYSNECMARMSGHSELVTGLKFTNDCKHLISASGDGCVFVWQVPHDMIVTMQARMSQQAMRMGHPPVIPRPMNSNFIENNDHMTAGSPPNMYMQDIQASTNYRFSEVGQLPQWAKKKTDEQQQSQSPLLGSSPIQTQKPRGRWAQRGQFDAETLDLRSIVESPFGPERQAERFSTNQINNNTPTSGYNSAGSKDVYGNAYLSEDSSIDSGRENRRQSIKQETPNQKMHSLNSESNTEHDDHDGDIEDMSDGERTNSDNGMIYYPLGGHATPTDFKVNEMDMTELRKSLRKSKAERQGLTLSTLSLAQATSDDEDEASTPSAENGERSLASTFGGSTDNIPQDNTFLQAALDGPGRLQNEKSRKSLSAMHNTDGISTSISKSFANSKKEELMKVINDAKSKLQKVGYRSNLRASQSISDLSHSLAYRSSQPSGMMSNHFLSSNDSDDSSIRRACSLSDLTMGKLAVKTNKTTTPSRNSEKRNLPKRSNSSVGRSTTSGMGLRSVSTGMLCQASDSEPEPNQPRGGLMRQTIASSNKQNVTQKYINPRSAAGIINRRKGMQNSYSTVNLSTTPQDGSSSEESCSANNNNRIDTTPINKPQVPPRPRNISIDHKRTVITLTASKKDENIDAPCKDSDPECDMTSQICSNLINQLMQTTSSVIQLHQRLKTSDEGIVTNGSASRNNSLMLKELENAVIMTQNMLTKITNNRNNSSSGESGIYTSIITNSHDRATINITPTANKNNSTNSLQHQAHTTSTVSANNGNGDFNQLMNKCSDLLSKVQRHVNS
ncbi:mitogen-activated protein kinase-binding protein 1 isoform X2 [Culicoides brevitarsis]|uniref:mitogen-activated protein kinase-binding protein 1 isoform X2 n=1 Tax=Culicoides brevitarsis TaxID=469753 RepID=UPI00307CA575